MEVDDRILILSSCDLDDDFFDDAPIIEECWLGSASPFKTKAMIDNGCTGYAFINNSIVREVCEQLQVSPVRLSKARRVKGYDGRMGGFITHAIYPRMKIRDHVESSTPMLITRLGHHDIILGKPWMRKHGVSYHGHDDTISFLPGFCTHYGSPERPFPSTPIPSEPESTPPVPLLPSVPTRILKRGEPVPEWRRHARPLSDEIKSSSQEVKTIDIAQIAAVPFNLLAKKSDVQIFSVTLEDIDFELNKKAKPITDPKSIVPSEYHDILDVFSKEKADELPPHRKYDHKIELLDGEQGPSHAPLYSMSEGELQLVKAFLKEHLDKGFIVPSSAPFASPVLYARKPNGGLRFCVDYRRLNAITKKNRYPLPLISELMTRLSRAKVFTKIDIRHAFNRIRMASEKDEDLTTFKTRFGTYKSLVLPFGLTNGPASFQHFINDVCMEYLDEFLVAYLDDLLIYSNSLKEHKQQVRKVLLKLREAGIYADIDKCEFHVLETKFLGVIVGKDGIRMDPAKVKIIHEWMTPQHLKQVQAFLGFVNFYRRFIRGFSKVAKPLIKLTRKNTPFEWSETCQSAFDELRNESPKPPFWLTSIRSWKP